MLTFLSYISFHFNIIVVYVLIVKLINLVTVFICYLHEFYFIKFIRMDKSQILDDKISIKMSLRDHSHIKQKKFIEYDQQQEERHIQSKSRRWWQKVDKRYFSVVTRGQVQQLRKTIIEDYYLTVQNLPIKQQSYFNRNLLSKHPSLFAKRNIKVLFQNNQTASGYSQPFFFSYYFGIKCDEESSYQFQGKDLIDQNEGQQSINNIQISYMKEKQWDEYQADDQIYELSKQLQLTCAKSTSDIDFLTQCNYYDLTKDILYKTQIDRQIQLWQSQYQKTQLLNNQVWQQIFSNIREQIQQENQRPMLQKIKYQGYDVDSDTLNIQQFLSWQHNLVNFKYGFQDKNQEMLAEALQGMWVKQNAEKDFGQKKKFFKQSLENLILAKAQLTNPYETDCKICFSTYVSQKNKVIYCDNCNQSFHQQCYGIQNLNQDPNSKYYCDACLEIMDDKKPQKHKINCQICSVDFSPLKKINQHFYHPSCLFLNNMLKSKNKTLELKENFNAQKIVNLVKTFQQQNQFNQCQYCVESCLKGLKFKCSQPYCRRYFHPICGYLNSAVFNIKRNKNNKLYIQARCWQHFPQRDHLRQIYLRRFFCNYRNSSDLSQAQFIELYKEQVEIRKQNKKQMRERIFRNLRKQHRKSNKQCKKKQVYSQNQYIILNSDDEQQNTDYQQSSTHEQRRNMSQKLNENIIRNERKGANFNSHQLKQEIQKISLQYVKRKNHKDQMSIFENRTLQKITPYLQNINKVKDSSFQDSFKEDLCLQAEVNTNSNDSDNQMKKIILE